VRARQELAVLDEQLAVVLEEADDARLRSLVSETPSPRMTTSRSSATPTP